MSSYKGPSTASSVTQENLRREATHQAEMTLIAYGTNKTWVDVETIASSQNIVISVELRNDQNFLSRFRGSKGEKTFLVLNSTMNAEAKTEIKRKEIAFQIGMVILATKLNPNQPEEVSYVHLADSAPTFQTYFASVFAQRLLQYSELTLSAIPNRTRAKRGTKNTDAEHKA